MIQEYKLPVDILMEEAGRRISEFIREYLPKHKKILICAGRGNNAGDALSSIRHLINFGYEIELFLISNELKTIPQKYFDICKKLDIPMITSFENLSQNLSNYNLIIDALLGFNFKGELREPYNQIIKTINNSKKSVLSIDIPSGIDCDEGIVGEYIKPQNILFMATAKLGCMDLDIKKFVADIGVPQKLYEKYDIDTTDIFKKNIIQID
jgi:NAD(P)H-hydrate epimerase